MSEQLALFDDLAPEQKLTCVSGYPWPCGGTSRPGCPGCRKMVADGLRAFRRDVRAGKYNRAGFTMAEWKRAGRNPDDWKNAPARKLPPFGIGEPT